MRKMVAATCEFLHFSHTWPLPISISACICSPLPSFWTTCGYAKWISGVPLAGLEVSYISEPDPRGSLGRNAALAGCTLQLRKPLWEEEQPSGHGSKTILLVFHICRRRWSQAGEAPSGCPLSGVRGFNRYLEGSRLTLQVPVSRVDYLQRE